MASAVHASFVAPHLGVGPPAGAPRVMFDSVSEIAETNVSDLVTNLARLSDAESVPRLCGAVDRTKLTATEEWLVTVVANGMPLAAILLMSPYGDDETLCVLARLIRERIVTLLA